MIYDVKLTIDYSYNAPSDHARNLLRLSPADVPGELRVLSRLLTVEPMPDERSERVDFFGNNVTSVVWHVPTTTVQFTLTARVERLAPPLRLDLSSPLTELPDDLANLHSVAPWSPHHYTAASRRAGPHPEMTAFAQEAIGAAGAAPTALAAVEAVGRAIHGAMRFDAEATDVDTPVSEAFANRHGVCQDFTHVMISCLRGIGIPAGYVSGFLRTVPPEGQPRLEGADAMHAWVAAWVGAEMGWVEYDPTNEMWAGTDHIAIARGRDYDDVAPVRGAMRGGGAQESQQAVDVISV